MLARDRVMTYSPGKPQSRAACAAACLTNSGRPFRSFSAFRTSWKAFSAARTFCENAVCSSARRAPMSVVRAFPASSSSAPARTNACNISGGAAFARASGPAYRPPRGAPQSSQKASGWSGRPCHACSARERSRARSSALVIRVRGCKIEENRADFLKAAARSFRTSIVFAKVRVSAFPATFSTSAR